MRTPQPNEITQLLPRWSRGDQSAFGQFMPAVYDELYELAHIYLCRKLPDHTLQPSALINEAYLRLIKQDFPRHQLSVNGKLKLFRVSPSVWERAPVGWRLYVRGSGAGAAMLVAGG
jgi:ECF sigma factor